MTGKALLFIGAFAALILLPAAYLTVGNLHQSDEDPAQVLESYLPAVYARDYRAADAEAMTRLSRDLKKLLGKDKR